MAGGIITISRRKYAAGLFWQPAPARGSPRDAAAKISRAAKMRAHLFASFGGMIGIAPRGSGARPGFPVAAAETLESLGEQTFLAAFAVREGIWILAVRGGIIIRDKVFSNVDEARADYAELNAMPDWGALIAPEAWSAPAAVERALSDFVSGSRKTRLAGISHLPGYIMTAILLVAAAAAGYVFFKEPIKKLFAPSPAKLQIDPKAAAEYKKKLAEIDAPPPAAPPKKVHVQMPYEALPEIAARADQCWRAIAFLSQQISGWVVDSVSCENGVANAHLLRSYGTIGDLYGEVREKMPNVAIDETGGSDVILTAKLRPLDVGAAVPELGADDVMTAVQSVFQRINEPVDFRRDYVGLELPSLGASEVYDTDRTDVPVVKIDTESKLSPLEFVKILDGGGVMSIPLIKWDNRNRNWIYEVIIFVK